MSLRQGKEAAEAEVLKTMEDTMVLIAPSFDLAVRQAGVLYGRPRSSDQFGMDMEVSDGQLVPALKVQTAHGVDQSAPNEDTGA